MKRRGQLALIAVVILAGTLLALVSIRTPNPYVAYERGHLQAAQLIHLARACFSATCDCSRLQSLLSTLISVNRSEPLRMYPTFSPCTADNPFTSPPGLTTEYRLKFTLATPNPTQEYVIYYARVESLRVEGTYTKTVFIGGALQTLTMVRVRLRYTNSYTTPFFNATVCPRLSDPAGVADFHSFNPSTCEWVIGVPRELSTETRIDGQPARVYRLRDEWNVIVPAYYMGG